MADSRSSSSHEKVVAVVDKPEEEKKVEQVLPVPFFQLFRFSTKLELIMNGLALIAAAAGGAAQPLMTLLFGKLVNSFVNFQVIVGQMQDPNTDAEKAAQLQGAFPSVAAAFRHDASMLALYLTLIGIGSFLVTYTYMLTWVYTGEVLAKRVREQYLRAVLRQDIAFFDNVGAGEVTTRIQTDTHLLQQGTSEKVALVVVYLSAFLTGFIISYAQSWRLALAMSSLLPVTSITGATMTRFISRYMQQSRGFIADSGTLAEEVIATIRTAQAFGSQKKLSDMYDTHLGRARVMDTKSAIVNGLGLTVFFFAIYAGYGLAFSFGVTLTLSGHANVGIVVNVFMAFLIGSFSLSMLTPELQVIGHARGAASKLYSTIDRVPQIDSSSPDGIIPTSPSSSSSSSDVDDDDESKEKPKDTVKGELKLTNITFSYPSRPSITVTKNLSLLFPSGKKAALVGSSGSGKSTVIALIERFYDPSSGVVELDGTDVRKLNLKWLRSQIGLVSQEPVLFATTIRENVGHGLINTRFERLSEEEKFVLIKEACVKANADGFISRLPSGYDTLVGERGFLLSGGQKQRVAIARAVVGDPRILLLDEATSALDTQSEGVVQDALDKAAAGRTTITIAHRLSTIKDADVIYVMGGGELIEQGTHNELLANEDGHYFKLVQAQKLREAAEAASAATGVGVGEEEDSAVTSTPEIEKQLEEEVPLGLERKDTTRSLASEVISEKARERGEEGDEEKDYSLFYLLRRMAMLNRVEWKRYMVACVTAVFSGFIYPSFGVVYAKSINTFTVQDRHELRFQGDRNALWFFVIAIGGSVCVGSQNFNFTSAAASLSYKIRSLSFRAILRQDIEFFDKDKNSTGALTSELSENAQRVHGLAGVTLGAIIQAFSTLVSGLILGLIFAPKIGAVGLACSPLLFTTGYIRLRVIVLKDQANRRAHAQSAQLACEAAASIRTVASLTREEDCNRLYSKSLEEPLRKSNKTALWSNGLFSLSQSMMFFVISLVFWYGSIIVSRLEITVFKFFIGLMCSTFAAMQAGSVFTWAPDISSAKGAASSIVTLLDSKPDIDAESTEGKPVDQGSVVGRLQFDNVHFRYPTRPGVRVLRGLSISIEPGTFVALVGQSGCGKSTVIQMVERFYDPLAGRITLDGRPINELNVSDYRKGISLVSQEPTLYAGTVRFNILLGAIKPVEEVTQEELEAACRDANILEFIKSLPDGFETEVGGKGSQLSGGQKQRIAIARALLRNPKILLLDEATSALDSTSEKVVQAALDQAAKGRTTIAIAHRLSTIQNADRIYFIKEGRVSEAGTHDQLLSKRGDYYEFVQLQGLSKRE
ncbi:ste6-like protein [Marasmius fiardii PR-910]|nr:ste6-like protein [Marasmius fiardii PR-910]